MLSITYTWEKLKACITLNCDAAKREQKLWLIGLFQFKLEKNHIALKKMGIVSSKMKMSLWFDTRKF